MTQYKQNKNKLLLATAELFRGYVKGTAVFYLVLLAVGVLTVFGIASASFKLGEHTGYLSYFGISVAIYMFVAGIAGLRADLRLCTQFGISRRTAFAGECLATLAACAAMALLNELLRTLFGLCAAAVNRQVVTADLYELLYRENTAGGPLGLVGHLQSALFFFLLMAALFALGGFFSLLFWNLHGLGIAAGVVGIVVGVNVLCWGFAQAGPLGRIATWALQSEWNANLLFVLVAAVFTAISYALLRRTNLRAAAK